MEQLHKVHLKATTGNTELKVKDFVPAFHGHWAGGTPNQGGVWHDGTAGAKIVSILDRQFRDIADTRCAALMPDGSQCEEIGSFQLLE